MKYSEAKLGRAFVIRLEDGDVLHTCIEQLAKGKGIQAGACIAVGGADVGSELVVGPKEGRAETIHPMVQVLNKVHEVSGTGTLFPDKNGEPVLHMHMACGRENQTITGCVRRGVKVWHVLEVILFELTETEAKRLPDELTGFELLIP